MSNSDTVEIDDRDPNEEDVKRAGAIASTDPLLDALWRAEDVDEREPE